MTRIRLLLAAALAGAVLVVAAASAFAAPSATRLTATVGPGFTITLKKGTTKVTRLKAGTYTITVRDRSGDHNFHLKGPGVNKLTSVDWTGTKTWTVRLRAGRYTFLCDPHPESMKGTFRVVS